MSIFRPTLYRIFCLLSACWGFGVVAHGANFTVNNLSDSGSTAGSLRWAVQQANATPNHAGDPVDVIGFDPAVFGTAQTITLTNGDLALTDASGKTIISGPGEGLLTISGDGADRVFRIDEEFSGTPIGAADVEVEIRDLSIANGNHNLGGGIHSSGVLALSRVTVTNCEASFVDVVSSNAFGGGIYNHGVLTMDQCRVRDCLVRAEANTQFAESYGGGIYNGNLGIVVLIECSVFRNRSVALNTGGSGSNLGLAVGGGICSYGSLSLDGCEVSGNVADADSLLGIVSAVAEGGGIGSFGSLTLRNQSRITGNTVNASTDGLEEARAFGGGIFAQGGSGLIEDSVIMDNGAEIIDNQSGVAAGGGISNEGTLTVRRCTISGNAVSGDANNAPRAFGGAAHNLGTLTVIDCAVFSNIADAAAGVPNPSLSFGGAIYSETGTLTIANSTLAGNTASGSGPAAVTYGGAVYLGGGSASCRNSTVTDNSATNSATAFNEVSGGGIRVNGGAFSVGNSIVAGNVVDVGGTGPDVAGGSGSLGHNLIGDASGATGLHGSDVAGVSATAVFFDVNGDAAITLDDLRAGGWPTALFQLKPGSPAIDAGDNSLIPTDPDTAAAIATDQRGVGYPRIRSTAVDVGPYEAFVVTAPSLHVFEGFRSDDFLDVGNWNSLGTPTPGAMATGETYLVAAPAVLAGAAGLEGSLQVDLPLTVAASGSLELVGGDVAGSGTLTVRGLLSTSGSGTTGTVSCPLFLDSVSGRVIDVATASELQTAGAQTWMAGEVFVGGQWSHGQSPLAVPVGSTLSGDGLVSGDVRVSGELKPGPDSGFGTLNFTGDLSLVAGATTEIGVSGNASGEFDKIVASGAVVAGGSLVVDFSSQPVADFGSYVFLSGGSGLASSFGSQSAVGLDPQLTFEYQAGAPGQFSVLVQPETFTFTAATDDDFLNPANWAGSAGGAATPAAMDAIDTYVLAAAATLSGAAVLSGDLTVSAGVTLTISATGSLNQNKGSDVVIADTGVLSNFGSYTLFNQIGSSNPTTLTTGATGGFINQEIATFRRKNAGYSLLGGRFTNHGAFTEDLSYNSDWSDATLINSGTGVVVLASSTIDSFTINNAGTITSTFSLDEAHGHTVLVDNSGTMTFMTGNAILSHHAIFNNLATGILNVRDELKGLNNEGIVNLTGDTAFYFSPDGDPWVNQSGGVINQGNYRAYLALGVIENRGTWTGDGEIGVSYASSLVVASGGILTNDGSWEYSTSGLSRPVLFHIEGTLSGSAPLNVPATNSIIVNGGTVNCPVNFGADSELILTDGTLGGAVTAGSGSTLSLTNGTVSGSVVAVADASLILAGGTVSGSLTTAADLAISEATSVSGSVTLATGCEFVVNPGVTLTIEPSGTMTQQGFTRVEVLDGAVLSNFGSYELMVGGLNPVTSLATFRAGEFVNQLGATFTRRGGGFSQIGGRFTNHGVLTDLDVSSGSGSSSWGSTVFTNSASGVVTMRTRFNRESTLINHGTFTGQNLLEEHPGVPIWITNEGILNLPQGNALSPTEGALVNTSTGVVNIGQYLAALDNSGVVNLTGSTHIMRFLGTGDSIINRSGGMIHQGLHEVTLGGGAFTPAVMRNLGAWDGTGPITIWAAHLAEGHFDHQGSWAFRNGASELVLEVSASLSGAALDVPAAAEFTLSGGTINNAVSTVADLAVTADSSVVGSLTLAGASTLNVHSGQTLSIAGAGLLVQGNGSKVVLPSGGSILNDGGWGFSGDGTGASITVAGVVAGSGSLGIPVGASLTLDGASLGTTVTTAADVSVVTGSTLTGTLALTEADIVGAGRLTVTGLLRSTGNGICRVANRITLNRPVGRVLQVDVGSELKILEIPTWTAGDVYVAGTVDRSLTVPDGGMLAGDGTIVGGLLVFGRVEPGPESGYGTLTVTENFSHPPVATTAIDVSGRGPGEFDRVVAGWAGTGGALEVNFSSRPRADVGTYEFVTASSHSSAYTPTAIGLHPSRSFGYDPAVPGQFTIASTVSAYEDWAVGMGLELGVNDGESDDANGDGISNLRHFADDTDPLGGGSDEGKQRIALTESGGVRYLTLTRPVRAGASFSGSPSPTATIDGMVYTVFGSVDLLGFDRVVAELSPALDEGLAALRDIDGDGAADWEYRTFVFGEANPVRGFFKAVVEAVP